MKNSQTIWVLVAGLAVGFIVGQAVPRLGSGGGDAPGTASSGAGTKAGGPTEIPANWITENDLGAAADFATMTPQQRYIALKVLNENKCDCGCKDDSVAECKKKDPACPRAPEWVRDAIAMAKQGKSAEAIAAAIKRPAAPSAPAAPAPSVPQKVELAAWTPVKGPKHAKITIVEFSDFQ